MTQWGKYDAASNVPLWISHQLNQSINIAMSDTSNELFNNVTANTYFTHRTDGVFAVDTNEMQAAKSLGNARPPHSGWSLRTVGSGGRAGRVSFETLVAGGSIGSGDAEDTVFPDYRIIILTQPTASNLITGNAVNLTVVATSVPSGATLLYQWQQDSAIEAGGSAGGPWANVSNVGVFAGNTTATLAISDNTDQNANVFRVIVYIAGGAAANVVSSNTLVTVRAS